MGLLKGHVPVPGLSVGGAGMALKNNQVSCVVVMMMESSLFGLEDSQPTDDLLWLFFFLARCKGIPFFI